MSALLSARERYALSFRGMRIVSLLPAATDIVAELEKLPELVGRTHECDWPAEVASVPAVTSGGVDQHWRSREISQVVGGVHRGSSVYTVDSGLLAELSPDVVLTQELCEVCAVSYSHVSATVRALASEPEAFGPDVLSLEPHTLDEVLDTVRVVGAALDAEETAVARIEGLRHRRDTVRRQVTEAVRPRVAALEWLDPLWPAGHWVPEQITAAGGTPVLAEPGEHTRPVSWEHVVAQQPDILLLLPCGFPPERTLEELGLVTSRPGWSSLPAVRNNQVWVLDGPSYFNRPGPRVVRGIEVLAHILHGVSPDDPVRSGEAHRVPLP